MTIVAVNLNGARLHFKRNEIIRGNKASTPTRVFVWLNGYLNSQEGIYCIFKLVKNVCGLVEQLIANTRFAWVTTWTALGAKVANYSIYGTTLPHAFTSIESLNGIAKEQRFVAVVKKVSDVVSSFMFAAMLVVNAPLGTAANLVVFAKDTADLVMETEKLALLQKMTSDLSVEAYTKTNEVTLPIASVNESKFLQMMKVAKVVVGVLAGVLFIGQFVLPMLSTHSVVMIAIGVCKSKMLAATLSVTGSVLAVYTSYYKTSLDWQLTKIEEA